LTPFSRLNPVEPYVSRPLRPLPEGLDSLRGAGQLRRILEIFASYHADYAPDPLATRTCATYISRRLRCVDALPARKRPHAPSSAAGLPPPSRAAEGQNNPEFPLLSLGRRHMSGRLRWGGYSKYRSLPHLPQLRHQWKHSQRKAAVKKAASRFAESRGLDASGAPEGSRSP
jgi:hypothetical protein